MQKHSKYPLQGKCKSAGETKKSKELHRLKSVPGGGGTPISLKGVNFRFWSRLACSGQNAIIFSRKGLF